MASNQVLQTITSDTNREQSRSMLHNYDLSPYTYKQYKKYIDDRYGKDVKEYYMISEANYPKFIKYLESEDFKEHAKSFNPTQCDMMYVLAKSLCFAIGEKTNHTDGTFPNFGNYMFLMRNKRLNTKHGSKTTQNRLQVRNETFIKMMNCDGLIRDDEIKLLFQNIKIRQMLEELKTDQLANFSSLNYVRIKDFGTIYYNPINNQYYKSI